MIASDDVGWRVMSSLIASLLRYEPFPIESCLQEQLHDHINAEVVNGTITSKQVRDDQ